MFRSLVRLTLILGAFVLFTFAPGALRAEANTRGKIKLLMVYNGGHDFNAFKSTMTPILKKTGDFETTIAKDFDALKKENLAGYNVVLFYGSGGDFTSPEQEKGLEQFVTNGGGMAGVHATDAHKRSDIYWRLLGGRFTTHGGGKFTVHLTDESHPITAGMKDFEINDETYQNADHPAAKMHSLGRMDRENEKQSMVWVQEYGKGRIFNTTLGHGTEAFNNPEFQRLVVRGLYWAAGKKPKNP